jgi:hypothetical protein
VVHPQRDGGLIVGPSLWLKAVHRLERAVGERVEAAVHSDTYFDFVTVAQRQQREAKALAESVSRRCLHLLNLPAGSAVRRVREQVARMDRRLAQIAKELEGGKPGGVAEGGEARKPAEADAPPEAADADGKP